MFSCASSEPHTPKHVVIVAHGISSLSTTVFRADSVAYQCHGMVGLRSDTQRTCCRHSLKTSPQTCEALPLETQTVSDKHTTRLRHQRQHSLTMRLAQQVAMTSCIISSPSFMPQAQSGSWMACKPAPSGVVTAHTCASFASRLHYSPCSHTKQHGVGDVWHQIYLFVVFMFLAVMEVRRSVYVDGIHSRLTSCSKR